MRPCDTDVGSRLIVTQEEASKTKHDKMLPSLTIWNIQCIDGTQIRLQGSITEYEHEFVTGTIQQTFHKMFKYFALNDIPAVIDACNS